MSLRAWSAGLLATFLAGLLVLPPGTALSRGKDSELAGLAPEHRKWLEEAALLIRKEERQTFLSLAKSYQRDAFIRRFWEARDPYPETERNEFRDRWYHLIEEARKEYGNLTEDRARTLLLHGPPQSLRKTDCGMLLWPIEIWFYARTENLPSSFYFIFVQKAAGGKFRLWYPSDGYEELQAIFRDTDALIGRGASREDFFRDLDRHCPVENRDVAQAVRQVEVQESLGLLDLAGLPPAPRDTEWLDTFLSFSTDLPAEAPVLEARLELGFPDRHQSRTVVQGVLVVPVAETADAAFAESGSFHFLLTAEVLRGDELFESFRYRFDVPASQAAGGTAPLVFERYLRPGAYRLIYKLEDLVTGSLFREERALEVPEVTVPAADEEVEELLAEAQEEVAAAPEEDGIELVLPEGETLTGALRVETRVQGEGIRKVEFLMDGESLLRKNRPPFSVEVNLGDLPLTRTLEAVAYDAAGRVVARDERVLNAGGQRFAVRLVEPRSGGSYAGSLTVRAEVQVPDGRKLDRLELFLGEQRMATLYQPPFVQPLTLPGDGETRFVRAVAYLADGASTETLTLINAPDYSEEIDVQLVELYASVVDGAGRLVPDLGREELRVVDGGEPQELVRFERVTDLPLHTVLLLDTSASMVESLAQAQRAALDFLRETLEPRDRAAIVTFSDRPRLEVKLTQDLTALAGGLAGLKAERGTALYDSVVFAVQYLKGIRGQRALLILSDGADRGSRFSFDQTLELARRSGVTVYSVGLGVGKLNLEARPKLRRLAEDTGGQSYFVEQAAELAGVYGQIQEQLRSRYLLVYQPSVPGQKGEFRTVDVTSTRPGLEVITLRGYYP